MTSKSKRGRVSAALKKWRVRIIVIVSLAWTAYNWSGLTDVLTRLRQAPLFAVLLTATEAAFIIGVICVLMGMGVAITSVFGDGSSATKRKIALAVGIMTMGESWYAASLGYSSDLQQASVYGLFAIGVATAYWSLRGVRNRYHEIIAEAPRNRAVRFGFHLNWFGAVGTGVVAAVGIIVLLPSTSWGLLFLPLADIVASFGWRAPIQWRLKRTKGYYVRRATIDDIDGIVQLDTDRYEDITPKYADDPHTMFIQRFNNAPDWFMVMVDPDGTIVGLLSMCPTNKPPESFKSWENSTHDGTLDGVVDPDGKYVYVVALTTSEEVGRSDEEGRLIAYSLGHVIRRGISVAYFSGRMPGLHHHPEMTPQQYYDAKDPETGKALDKQIARYEGYGMRRKGLVKDGFAADSKSRGYGVLFQYDLPFSGWPLRLLAGPLLRYSVNRPRLWRRVKELL